MPSEIGAFTNATPGELAILVNAIPTAEDGHVISRDYHNSLKAAVAALAGLLTQTGVAGGNVTLSMPPSFLENAGGPNWMQTNGIATPPTTGSAKGWIPLQLPQAARLQRMTVKGFRGGTISSFMVKLIRVPHAEPDPLVLVTMQLKPSSGDSAAPFEQSASVTVANAGPAALEEYRRVDNDRFSYLVTADATNVQGGAEARITSIQIEYSRA